MLKNFMTLFLVILLSFQPMAFQHGNTYSTSISYETENATLSGPAQKTANLGFPDGYQVNGTDGSYKNGAVSYEAENATLSGQAQKSANSGASGGYQVNDMGGGYKNGKVTFSNVNAVSAGNYKVTVYYCTADPRDFFISANGQTFTQLECPKSGGWSTVASTSLIVNLKAGTNTIRFDNGSGFAPNLDRITVEPMNSQDNWNYSYGNMYFEYDCNNGTYDMSWNGIKRLKNIYSSVLQSTRVLKSIDYTGHIITATNINDSFGTGVKITIANTGNGLTPMNQYIYLYSTRSYYLTEVELNGTNLSSNNMAPIELEYNGAINIGSITDGRMLYVPFDNDSYTNYVSNGVNSHMLSYEATALFDNTSRNGLIFGSVTHDTWKTGISVNGWNNTFNSLRIYGGVSNSETRDVEPHGSVMGSTIKSPKILVGFYKDWRAGMEDYSTANTIVAPKLSYSKGVPFAWNSWAAYEGNVTPANVMHSSDFIKKNLQSKNFQNDNTVFINYDAFWEGFSDADIINSANHIRANGQTPGGYLCPFSLFTNAAPGVTFNTYVPGTNNVYKYRDIVLKDAHGNILTTASGGYPLDPTHPGTKQRVDYYFKKFNSYGWKYLKMDFMSMGAMEGVHYDTNVKTGIQAYNQGMSYINGKVDTNNFLLSLSISPLFPSHYAHARRMACDTWGGISASAYGARAVNYGWWVNQTLYEFNDPDHIVLVDKSTEAEAKTRVNLSVISGTVFLDSDNFYNKTAQTRAINYLTNANINALAKKNKAFRPVEGNTGNQPANVYVLNDNGTFYLALFNFNSSSASTINLDLSRAGLSGTTPYTVTDLWTGATSSAMGKYSIKLPARSSTIMRLN